MGITIDQTLLGLMGIAVSVILFVIGYRQTIGAKNERIASANKEIERILIRRIVLESYNPTRDDIARLLAGKARDFRVSEDDLASEGDLYTSIFTRIFESDLIPSAQRDEILTRLNPVIAEAERDLVRETESTDTRQPSSAGGIWPLVGFALAASIVGVLIMAVIQPGLLGGGAGTWLVPAVVTFAGSLGAIWIFLLIIRFRATQEGDIRDERIGQLANMDKDVLKILRSAGEVQARGRARGGFGHNYVLNRSGAKTLVQLNMWRRYMPSSFVNAVIGQVEETTRRHGASEAIVVTTMPVSVEDGVRPSKVVRFMTVEELRDYLSGGGASKRGQAA